MNKLQLFVLDIMEARPELVCVVGLMAWSLGFLDEKECRRMKG